MTEGSQRIAAITLDERSVLRRSPEIEQERASAINDLISANGIAPASGRQGPFHLRLALREDRLEIDIDSIADGSSETIALSLRPFRRLVKDYFLVCGSYYEAIHNNNLGQVEAIDMGRRGLHDEAAALLIERLADKAAIDHDTARRLFTLICVLSLKASAPGFGPHPRPS